LQALAYIKENSFDKSGFFLTSSGVGGKLMLMKAIIGMTLPLLIATLGAQEMDYVAKGKETFGLWGCSECHVSTKEDNSIKTGPSLYNLFQLQPRDRAVNDADGKMGTIKADKDYFLKSVRQPALHLAISESGPTKGTTYPAIMPQFTPALVSDADLEMIWHYLHHAADEGKNGPAKVMGPAPKQTTNHNPLADPDEVIVSQRPRMFRAPLLQASGRAIHVGLPNGYNYSFDPRFFSLRGVWTGGFLNLKKERTGRSTPGSERGKGSETMLDAKPFLTPLTADGKVLDLEFKEPDVADDSAVEKHLWKGGDFMKELASWDCEFKGYEINADGEPEFLFRMGKNLFRQKISFTGSGEIVITLVATTKSPQVFQLREDALTSVKVEGGKLEKNRWTLPAAKEATYRLVAQTGKVPVARTPVSKAENLAPQALVVEQSKAALPPGYTIENWLAPTDTFGRKQLFEPTAIAVAKDGTIVVGTRTAGIWRLKNKQWELFAEGMYECLGLVIEDHRGDVIVIAQKPELTRISDSNRDGKADRFQTVCDDFGFHGNYHEYTHGPVRDAAGNYYFTLNLCHSNNVKASYKAGGNFMGSMGGFRGWACRVTPAGVFEPYASGVRSPAGLGMDPEGRIVYIDNQGEYFGSSKISYLIKDHFYGHPSGLVSLPGMTPSSPEIVFEKWQPKTHVSALWFPHSKYANSPGNPAWDQSKGKFGPYAGQMFVGDQTISTLARVQFEKVGKMDQGTMVMFSRDIASGVMRPCFLPDSSLLLGQTGRGWQSKGGNQAALQRVTWDGKTIPADIHHIHTMSKGLRVHFTTPLQQEVTSDQVRAACKINSWTYTDAVTYGSRENEKRENAIEAIVISKDRQSIELRLPDFAQTDQVVNRLYQVVFDSPEKLFTAVPARAPLDAYQTIRAVPEP
jgi:hypothetical protein